MESSIRASTVPRVAAELLDDADHLGPDVDHFLRLDRAGGGDGGDQVAPLHRNRGQNRGGGAAAAQGPGDAPGGDHQAGEQKDALSRHER
jgi:hypothetical protein